MRAKVVLSAAALGVLILAPAIYFHFAPSSPAPEQQAPAPEPVAVAAPVAAPVVPHHRSIAPSDGGQGVSVPDANTADHDEYVHERRQELTQLGSSDDPEDLKTILTELNNKDPQIRSAALSATVQFGSRDAIPALQNEMSWTEDPEEKVNIQNAIKYLNLPSFGEYQANLAASAARAPSDQQPAPAN